MLSQIRPAIVLFLLLTLITGVAYPLATTGVAQAVFPHQANGSLISSKDGKTVVGSSLIGQPFAKPGYFWSRPSATTPSTATSPAAPCDPQGSVGSNKTPVGDEFKAAVEVQVKALRDADPDNKLPIPQDLVTASASGLDPHISPAAAEYQVHRVAKARNLSEDAVRELVAEHTEKPQFGLLGDARVNVLELNLALDAARDLARDAMK